MKKILQILFLLLILATGLSVMDGFFTLEEGQQAVITQFGKPVGEPLTKAGLKFKMPFVQKVRYFEKKILIWDGEPNQIPTNDKTFIYLDTTARWRISDALRFLQAVGSERYAQSLLDDILDGTLRDLVNKNNLIEIIRSSDWTSDYIASTHQSRDMIKAPNQGRDVISDQVLEAASKVTPQYGIELIDVMFKRVNYIDSVRERVYDRMISERKRIAAEKRSLGEGRKAEILGRVERELQEIISTAKKEAMEIKGEADAKATKIYGDVYSKDPEFYAFIRSLESYRDIITDNTSLVLSSDSDLFKYLKKVEPEK
ncbi:protease modulator HflC [Desulfogranum japonicum]|uniref:protease modulator HflC n=1 Tax=Desulfogranum japonicum TaxID=231447 RepID=UPI000415719D|nr:protease modulator HflC [Desulfogranum japonicum]